MAKLFFQDKPIMGVDIGSTSIKVMSIDASKWLVLGYGSIDLDPAKARDSLSGDNAYLTERLIALLQKNIIGTIPSNHAAISLPTSRTYLRTFTLPAKLEKTLPDAVQIETEQYIPIPASALYIDYEITERSKKELTVLMSAVSHGVVDSTLAIANAAGLRPVLMEPGVSSVARVLAATEDGHLPTVIVDVGPASTDIAVLEKGFIRVAGNATVGGNTLTLDIAKKMGISLENAHQLKVLNGLNAGPRQRQLTTALKPSLERVAKEIERVMRYYNERLSNESNKLEQLLIVGGGSNVPGIGDYFTNRLVMPARVASPWQKLNFDQLPEPAKQFRPHYITAAGLASIPPAEVRKR